MMYFLVYLYQASLDEGRRSRPTVFHQPLERFHQVLYGDYAQRARAIVEGSDLGDESDVSRSRPREPGHAFFLRTITHPLHR